MENTPRLPFKVGELAEARTFEEGYRGAWFRCKIRDIAVEKGDTLHELEYYDYPDEKLEWVMIYQLSPNYVGKGKEISTELMLRPCYPPIYDEKQMPDVNVNSDVVVIVNNSWMVGDLVDWLDTGCYWSGRIIELLGDDKAKVNLPEPPLGEGSVYEVLLKDVRPSLEWSPEFGWTLPTQDNGPGCFGARLIKPTNPVTGGLQTADTRNGRLETEADQGLRFSSPATSNSLAVSDDVMSMETTDIPQQTLGPTVPTEVADVQGKSTSTSAEVSEEDFNSRADVQGKSTSASAEVSEEDLNSSCPVKGHKVSEGVTLHSMHSDTLEAAILDLEEHLNKVRTLKRMLKCGVSPSDNTPSSQWKFLEPGAPS